MSTLKSIPIDGGSYRRRKDGSLELIQPTTRDPSPPPQILAPAREPVRTLVAPREPIADEPLPLIESAPLRASHAKRTKE